MIGYDLSHYQSAVQLAQAIRSGDFVFVKATEGTGYVDPEHDVDIAAIRAGKRIAGHYHFAQDVGAAYAEAQWFLDNANLQPGDLVALDLESMNGSWAARAAYGAAWLTYVQKASGAVGFRYMNGSWHDALEAAAPGALDRWPLWIAVPGVQPGQPGVNGWVIHQYSTAGGIDHDVTSRDLTPYAVPPLVVPPPPPHPSKERRVFWFRATLPATATSPACPQADFSWDGVNEYRWLAGPDKKALVAAGVQEVPAPTFLATMHLNGPRPQ